MLPHSVDGKMNSINRSGGLEMRVPWGRNSLRRLDHRTKCISFLDACPRAEVSVLCHRPTAVLHHLSYCALGGGDVVLCAGRHVRLG